MRARGARRTERTWLTRASSPTAGEPNALPGLSRVTCSGPRAQVGPARLAHYTAKPGQARVHYTAKPGQARVHYTAKPGQARVHYTAKPGQARVSVEIRMVRWFAAFAFILILSMVAPPGSNK